MPPSKQKSSRKPSNDKFYHSKRGTHDNYRMNNTKQSRHVQRRVNKDTQKKIETPLDVMLNSDSESRTDSDNEDDINQLDSSGDVSSQSSSDQDVCIKGNCSCRPKTINVISRDQEFILDTLRKVEDEKTKQNLYEVFKKSVVKVEAKKTVNPYNLNDILSRFDHQSPKEVSIKELHEEVKQHKNEIKELRQFISIGLSDLQDQINRIGNQENHMDIPNLLSVENCLQEGLVPISLCEESSMSLFGADSKDLPPTLLGIPFLSSIYPMWVDNQGIRTKLCDKEILLNLLILLNASLVNTQVSNSQKPQSSQANQSPSSHKMLWSQQFLPRKFLCESDDSTSYLPDNGDDSKHVSTQDKALITVDRRLLGCKRVGVTSHKVSNQEIYKKGTFNQKTLDNISVEKHKKNGYNFIHFGMIQVAAKPLTRLGLNTAIVMCLRDNRHLEYRDSIIGTIKPDRMMAHLFSDILDSVVPHIKTHGFKIKPERSVSIITNKSDFIIPKKILWKDVDFQNWHFANLCSTTMLESIEQIVQYPDGGGERSSPNLSTLQSPRVSFMNLLELQALPSRLEPLGKK
ncbi:hypothetical protein AAG906_005921 [Vitis piasezkii]